MSSLRNCGFIRILLILISLVVLGHYIRHDSTSLFSTLSYRYNPRLRARETLNVDQCGLNGDNDLYGIGIRVGYYTQAVAVWFANFFVLEETRMLRAVNTLFMFAMMIGLVWFSHAPSKVFAIEAFLLIQLLSATWYVGLLDKSRFSHKCWQFNPARLIIREGSLIGLTSYNIWFWWTGLDLMKVSPCGTYVLFMAKVNLYTWFRSAHKVLSIAFAVSHPLLSISTIAQLVLHFKSRHIRDPAYYKQLEEQLLHELSELDASACTFLLPPSSDDIALAEVNATYRDAASSPISESFFLGETRHTDLAIGTVTESHAEDHERCSGLFIQDPNTGPGMLPAESSPCAITGNETLKSSELHPLSPAFEDLLAADTYLANILESLPAERHTLRMTLTQLKLYTPLIPPRLFHIIYTHPIRVSLLTPLFLHIYSLRTYFLFTYPLLLSSALTSSQHPTLSATTLTTFLSFHKANLPRENRKYYYMPSATLTFLMTLALVLTIELSIRWNHIQGVNDLGTVGQLVPAVLGVGGLVKVLWSWTMERLNREGKAEDESAVNRCARVYYDLKEKKHGGTAPGPQQTV